MTTRRFVVVAGLVITGFAALAPRTPSFAQAPSESALPKFAGTWKEDVSRRKGSLTMLTFRRTSSGGLEELRGSELRPLVQFVNFSGKPYAIDGSKNTIAWKQIDATRFERAIYADGRLLNTRRIQLSADGKTLTQETEAIEGSGGKTTITIVFRREAGDQGLAGRWRETSYKTSTPQQVTYEVAGNRLKITTVEGNTTSMTLALDSKPVPVDGDAVISGTMTAARQVDGSTLEFTMSREGTATGRSVRVVSADGKTMTVTTTQLGPNAPREPAVMVYVKQ